MQHGLSEQNAGQNLRDHTLMYSRTYTKMINGNNVLFLNAFDEFYKLMTQSQLPSRSVIKVADLLEQIILGHRLWCDTERKKERFLRLAAIHYYKSSSSIWIKLYLYKDELVRLDLNQSDIMKLADLDNDFQQINEHISINDRECVCYEQVTPLSFSRLPSEKLNQLSSILKNKIWEVLIDNEPYRKYYLFLNHDRIQTMNQLCSSYALSFYFSSITRYRPKQFADFLLTNNGPQIKEFINNQIYQTVYSMASEFSQRDIFKPNFI
jgi:hypothetical protein